MTSEEEINVSLAWKLLEEIGDETRDDKDDPEKHKMLIKALKQVPELKDEFRQAWDNYGRIVPLTEKFVAERITDELELEQSLADRLEVIEIWKTLLRNKLCWYLHFGTGVANGS